MGKWEAFREKIRAELHEGTLSSQGFSRLLLIILSVIAAKAFIRVVISLVIMAATVYWVRSEIESPDGAEISGKAAQARQYAEETKQIVDSAHDQASAAYKTAEMRQKETAVQRAVQEAAVALIGYNTDMVVQGQPVDFQPNYDQLANYGFRRNNDLIYDDIKITGLDDQNFNFLIVIRHRDPGPRAFKYDSESGSGVEPVE